MNPLAYTPFLDPLDLHGAWFVLLVPLAFLVAMAYKAVRVPDLRTYWRHTVFFALQILGGILGLYILAMLLVRVGLPVLL
jgi:hypothetical protein